MHPLLARAKDLSRRIYASLPWGYRLAGLMMHLASSLTDAVGRAFYLEFVKAGIAGLPLLQGAPPARNLKSVPSGYGRRFGDILYATVLRKTRNPDLAEEVITQALAKVAEGSLKGLREGVSLNEAERYATQMVLNTLRDSWRKGRGYGQEARSYENDDVLTNLTDPESFRDLDQMISRSDLSKLMRDLERVDARAPSWLEAKLDGLTGIEIAQEWGVGKSRVSMWEKEHLSGIRKVLNRYVQDAA